MPDPGDVEPFLPSTLDDGFALLERCVDHATPKNACSCAGGFKAPTRIPST